MKQSQLRNRKRKQSPETKSPETKSPETKATSNNFAAPPVIPTMNRIGHNIIQNPTAAKCAECCSRTGKIVSGAAVGATLGACAGCACAGHFAESPFASVNAILPKVPLVTGAAGAVIGAAVGPSKCLELGKEACDRYKSMVDENPGLFFGGKKKTRKRKQKKRRKTHKTKRKNKKRRSRKSNKSRRSKHLRKRKTRKNKKKSHKK